MSQFVFVLITSCIGLGIFLGYKLHGIGGSSAKGDKHKGWASRAHINADLSARAVRKSAKWTRPHLQNHKKAPVHEVGVLLGYQAEGQRPRPRIMAKLEDSQIVLGPPGGGKTIRLKEMIKDFPGPVIATSTKLDIIEHTAARRKQNRGPVFLFNPEGLGGQPSSLRWNPVSGCQDRETAINRAGYLLSGTAAGGAGNAADREFWTNQANKVLRAYLLAAAHAGVSLMTVKEWANKPKDRTAVKLLMAIDDPELRGWADELSQILDSYDRFRESVFATLAQTFDFLGSPGAREVVELSPDDVPFDAEEFLRSRATLYCIGAHKDYGSIAPLFCALTGLIYDTAKQLAQQNRSGRLDPPVLFALDEAPNVVPLPLHRLTSEARGLGITFVVCIQSRQQLDDVWTPTRGSIIWNNCKVKMILPAVSDGETLDLVSKLCGTYEAERQTVSKDKDGKVSTSTIMETRPTFPPEAIRMLPDFTSLVLYGNHRPVKVSIDPFWERRSVKRAEAKAAKRAAQTRPPASPPPRPGGRPVPDQLQPMVQIYELPRHTGTRQEEGSSGD